MLLVVNMLDGNSIQEASSESDGKFFVVGIGASAGGIAPLLGFFNQVPADSGLSLRSNPASVGGP